MQTTQTTNPRRVSVEWVVLWVILALAFALSFRALVDVGEAAGLGELSWALPVIVDGFAILAARVISQLDGKMARVYPWALLIALGAISAWWNALHAGGAVELTVWQARIVAGSPPVILGLAYHLLRMVSSAQERAAQRDARRAAEAERRAQARSGRRAPAPAERANTNGQGAPERADDTDQAAPDRAVPAASGAPDRAADADQIAPEATPVARRGSVKERAWEWYRQQREAGQEPTAPDLARAVDTSDGNARKLVREFGARWDEHKAQERRANISVVGADQ